MVAGRTTIQIVIFRDQGYCYCLVQTGTPTSPVRYTVDFDDVALLTQGLCADATSIAAQRELGQALNQRLLPESVARFLGQCEAQYLVLHLDEALFPLPWERLFDGTSFLAERFHLGCRLLTAEPLADAVAPMAEGTRSILQLLPPARDPSLHGPMPDLHPELAVSRLSTACTSHADILQAADKVTVIHYVGPYDGGWVLADGALQLATLGENGGRLALVISEFEDVTAELTAPICAATRGNLRTAHVVCVRPAPQLDRASFNRALYAALCRGQTVGQAVTEARRSLLSAGLPGWSAYRLHGNPAARVFMANLPTPVAQPDPAYGTDAELRQLTVLFCDLVDSTAASEDLDIEEWDSILKLYNCAATAVVNRHGGVIHQYKGDGLVVYFGYPIAFEDAAARAVHAALELVHDMEHGCAEAGALLRACGRAPLAMRVGIHTGPVVVADISGNATATGRTVAFCERIHRVAPKNGVIVSAATRSLLARHFDLTALGPQVLKGISTPVDCFLVRNARESQDAVLSDPTTTFTPFCGRQRELQALQDAWQHVTCGQACTVLLSGEAGIGKSRLLRQFRDVIAAADAVVIGCVCSAYFQNNAFYPVVQGLRRMMQLDGSDTVSAQLDQVEKFVAADPSARNVLPALASLLGLSADERAEPLNGTADQQKTAIIDALVSWLQAAAGHRPVLLWVEDVHWIDATTFDFLTRLATELTTSPIMMLMTFRAESGFAMAAGVATLHSMALTPLPAESARAMVVATPGSERLPPRLVNQIVERTDGVPLFIEESTRMAMDFIHARAATPDAPVDPGFDLKIPSTLQGLLTARLDQLGKAKYVAQLGSVIGRTFSLDTLEAVSEVDATALANQLTALTATGLVKASLDDAGITVYSFKHALVRDTAYSSLLGARRREMHCRIAEVLEERGFRARSEGAELLAHHYAQSEQIPQAIACWMLAAQRALRSAGQREAIGHLDNALKALRRSSDEVRDRKTELRAEVMRAACLTAVAGYSASEVGAAFQRAERLALEQQDYDTLLRARFGIEAFHLMRADFARALDVARECKQMTEAVDSARAEGDPTEKRVQQQIVAGALADWTIGNVLFHQAQFDVAIPHMERSIARCARVPDAERRQVQDPAVMCWIYKGWHAWEAGFPDRAMEHVETGIATAYRTGHPFGIGVALAFKSCVRFFRREYTLAVEAARQSIQYSSEPSFRIWWAWARVILGRSLSDQAHTRAEGIEEIREGLRMWDASEAIVTRPFNLALLAEAYHADGRTADALELLAVADQTIQRHGERYYEPEVKRLQGVMRAALADSDDEHMAACAFFDQAAAIARRQVMPSSELRALSDRVRLYPQKAGSEPSWQRLADVFSSFREGHATADVSAARALLKSGPALAPSSRENITKGRKSRR